MARRAVFVTCSLLILMLALSSVSQKSQEPDALSLTDDLEFAAIQAIHGQLDDNADGNVDLSESEEFVQTELCGESSKSVELEVKDECWSDKSQKFHKTDLEITSAELWITWHRNEVFNWTNDDVIEWLENYLELPQYSEIFKRYQITGRHLPKLATNTAQILQTVLRIHDSQHRQKVQLRAMDVILFGPPIKTGYLKDAVLVLFIALSVLGGFFALRQRIVAQSSIDLFLEDIRLKEEELKKLKAKVELQEMVDGELEIKDESGCQDNGNSPPNNTMTSLSSPEDQSCSDEDLRSEVTYSRSSSVQDPESSLNVAQEEIEALSRKVLSQEIQLEATAKKMSSLQGLLQDTHHRERKQLDFRKNVVEEEMTKAQKVCDKIKKRRSTLLGTFHIANSSTLEEAGLQITKAVNKMQAISDSYDEFHKRWNQIERVCKFSIISLPPSPVTSHSQLPSTAALSSLTLSHRASSPHLSHHSSISRSSSLSSSHLSHSHTASSALMLALGSSTFGQIERVSPYDSQRRQTIATIQSTKTRQRKKNSLPEVVAYSVNKFGGRGPVNSVSSLSSVHSQQPESEIPSASLSQSQSSIEYQRSSSSTHIPPAKKQDHEEVGQELPMRSDPPSMKPCASYPLLRKSSYTEAMESNEDISQEDSNSNFPPTSSSTKFSIGDRGIGLESIHEEGRIDRRGSLPTSLNKVLGGSGEDSDHSNASSGSSQSSSGTSKRSSPRPKKMSRTVKSSEV